MDISGFTEIHGLGFKVPQFFAFWYTAEINYTAATLKTAYSFFIMTYSLTCFLLMEECVFKRGRVKRGVAVKTIEGEGIYRVVTETLMASWGKEKKEGASFPSNGPQCN